MMFSLVCFSLYGQTSREPKIFIAPIDGFGREADNDYIYKRLTYEVILQFHTVVKSKYDSNYVFKGTIDLADEMSEESSVEQVVATDTNNPVPVSPIPPISNDYGRREFFSMVNGDGLYFYDSTGTDNTAKSVVRKTTPLETEGKEKKYYFKLEMTDNRTGEVISRQNFIFVNADASVDSLISTLVTNLLSDIPEGPFVSGDLRNRWMYVETSALWTPRIYFAGYDSIGFLDFGAKLGLECHFLNFMSVGAGAQVTWEQVDDTADFLLETPVAVKFVFKLGENFALEPYGGASFNYSILKKIHPCPFSWFAGVQFGIKDKKEIGLLVFDARFAMDFSHSSIPETGREYQRYCFQLGVGYKFGFLQKRDNVK